MVRSASRHLLLALPPDPGSARLARRAVMRLPSLRDRRRLLFDVQLAVSELVSTGVENARPDETLRLAVHADELRLRIEVRGLGTAVERYDDSVAAGPHTLRGLQVVAAVADRWGIEWHEGSMVWAEFDLRTE